MSVEIGRDGAYGRGFRTSRYTAPNQVAFPLKSVLGGARARSSRLWWPENLPPLLNKSEPSFHSPISRIIRRYTADAGALFILSVRRRLPQ